MTRRDGPNGKERWLPHDVELAQLLAQGLPHAEAAARLGMSKSTVGRRLARTWFRDAVGAARAEAMASAMGAAVAAAAEAVETLVAVAKDDSVPPGVRCRAATALLQAAIRLREHVELAEKVDELWMARKEAVV